MLVSADKTLGQKNCDPWPQMARKNSIRDSVAYK